MTPLRILFSEGSSLTAREFLSVLGPAGHHIQIVNPNPLCICRFSRWTRRVHPTPAPGLDPMGYVEAVNALLSGGQFDVLLPTHEQAWLFAAGRSLLKPSAPVAVASEEAFSQVESKIKFARLLDDAGLPQPKWGLVNSDDELGSGKLPFISRHRSAPQEPACAECRVPETLRAPSWLSGPRGTKAHSWLRPLQKASTHRFRHFSITAVLSLLTRVLKRQSGLVRVRPVE